MSESGWAIVLRDCTSRLSVLCRSAAVAVPVQHGISVLILTELRYVHQAADIFSPLCRVGNRQQGLLKITEATRLLRTLGGQSRLLVLLVQAARRPQCHWAVLLYQLPYNTLQQNHIASTECCLLRRSPSQAALTKKRPAAGVMDSGNVMARSDALDVFPFQSLYFEGSSLHHQVTRSLSG